MSPIRYPAKVEYKPIPVKSLLKNMKNFSSLMLDLAYYSILYNDRGLAKEVMRLEEFVDSMRSILVMQAALAVRDAEDAESMVSVFRLATSTDKISDAAADIASITLYEMRLHPSIAIAILSSEEVVSRVKIRKNSNLEGRSLEDIFEKEGVFVDILALRRGGSWYLSPSSDIKMKLGDVLIIRGSREAVEKIRKLARDETPKEEVVAEVEEHLKVGGEIAKLKNIVDVMVDLAYHAMMFNDEDVAREVLDLEDYVDSLTTIIERRVVKELFKKGMEDEVVTTIRVVMSLEGVADAAAEMASVIISGLRPHPILKSVVEESEERIIVVKVPREYEDKRIGDLNLEIKGATVLSIKRGEEWIFDPEEGERVREGDILVIKVFSEALKSLREMFKVGEESSTSPQHRS